MNIVPSSCLRSLWKGCKLICAPDAKYAVPDQAWLLDTARTHARSKPPWIPAFDCDDFAFSLKLTAQALHARATPLVDGLAVGVVFYKPEGMPNNHAVNWSLKEGSLWFLEPQTGRIASLSPSEVSSAFFVYC